MRQRYSCSEVPDRAEDSRKDLPSVEPLLLAVRLDLARSCKLAVTGLRVIWQTDELGDVRQREEGSAM